MVNCAHGKDRTGIVSAMVLGVLGKTKEEIAEDYARSEVTLTSYTSHFCTVHEFIQYFDQRLIYSWTDDNC